MCLIGETREYKSALGAVGDRGIDRVSPAGGAPCLLLSGTQLDYLRRNSRRMNSLIGAI